MYFVYLFILQKEELEKERVDFYMHCISTPVVNAEKKKKYTGKSSA